MRIVPRHLSRLAAVATLSLMCAAGAAVLPDDRADVFWSSYKGGGMDITGESVLVRKKFSEQFAVEGNYYVDKVSGASVDVLSQASVIKEERKQKRISVDYIHDKTTYDLAFTNSTERDYISNTFHFSLSQDMFGDLTTVNLGFTNSNDKVGENNGTASTPIVAWLGRANSRSYEGGLSQIITKNLIAGTTVEVITDQGLLSNPYRSIRYRVDPSINPLGYALGTQVYPNTHTSTAVEARAKYYLPYRAAASVSYRFFSDTWGIHANTIELDYVHPLADKFIFEGRVRHYSQNAATFYSDLFTQANQQNFEGRDQNLAAQTNNTFDLKVTYAFLPQGWKVFKRATATFDVTRIQFKYSDFRNIKYFNNTPGGGGYQPGTEPLYAFDAMVYQVYLSMFF
jgi:Protein of unknown function (DUF3570)